MWQSDKVLAKTVKRTGLSVPEIQKRPWSELEDKMKIEKTYFSQSIRRKGHQSRTMRKITRKMFDADEKLIMNEV